TPHGGSWDVFDNGAYTVAVVANQVADTDGQPVPAGAVGTFQVAVPPPSAAATVANVTTVGGTGYTVTVIHRDDVASDGATLRAALADANAQSSGPPEIIDFEPAVFGTPRTITLTSGPLTIADAVTIAGPGAGLLMVSGNNAGRIVNVTGTGSQGVAISGLRL